ncbi:MAG: Sensor histidine kinase YycG [candidate division WS6 bacterium OLB21]|uniref:histidine kinase n=1 Tax=candidate division WS6 bacterium OLB21 TaxID=1617427 RepID=A0A136KKC2_9BACT|nr:MAG: Sensor histidine kinase YycG [candidate division WS6 bacterium OLB21]
MAQSSDPQNRFTGIFEGKQTSQEEIYRISTVRGLMMLALLVTLALVTINAFAGNTTLAIAEIVIGLAIIVGLVSLHRQENVFIARWIVGFVMLYYLILVIALGGFKNLGLYWLFVFPPSIFLIWGRNKSIYWFVVFLSICILSAVLVLLGVLYSPYEPLEIAIFSLGFLLSIIYIFRYQNYLEEQRISLDHVSLMYKEAADEAQENQERLAKILFSIGDAVIVLDKDRKITMVNPIAEKISGFTADLLIGTKLFEVLRFVHADSGSDQSNFVDTVYNSGRVTNMDRDTVLITKSEERIPVGDSAAPIFGVDGRVNGCIIVFRDITQESEIDKMKSEFVSLASHQLQTPITQLLYTLELLQDKNLLEADMKPEDLLQQAVKVTEEMRDLVKDLLDVSRIESGKKFNLVFKQENMLSLLQEVISEVKPTSEQRGINIELSAASGCENVQIEMDRSKIKEVILNLLSNAVKYSKPTQIVKVRVLCNNENMVVQIEDNGIGIPKNEQSRIFTKLFRANNVRSQEIEGTGLGLYIAKSIIEAHSGRIYFESVENVHTIFTFELPFKQLLIAEQE